MKRSLPPTYKEQSAPTPKASRWHWLVSLGGGIVTALCFPPFDCTQLVWVAMIPLLYVLWNGPVSFRRGFGMAWLYGMGYFCTSFYWITEVAEVFNIPQWLFAIIAYLPLFAYFSFQVGLWGGITATFLRPRMSLGPITEGLTAEQKKEAWWKWVLLDMATTLRSAAGCAALWVCVEWWRGHGHISFGWNSFGTALYDGLAFAQWAEFVGLYPLSFLPVFTSVVILCAVRRCVLHFKSVGKAGRPWDFYATVVVLFLLFGGGLTLSRLYSPLTLNKKESTLQLPVMAVHINKDQQDHLAYGSGPSQYRTYLSATMAAFHDIQLNTAKKAMEHPELGFVQQLPLWVVWPESALGCPIWRDITSGQLLPDSYTCDIFLGEEGLPMVRHLVQQMGGQPFTVFTGADEMRLEPQANGDLRKRGMHNSIACIPGDFDSILTAPKQHLMPFGEYLPYADKIEWIKTIYEQQTNTIVGDGILPGTGSEPLTVTLPGTNETVGVIPAVCYEDTVGDHLAQYARPGAQVIVNASNDAWFRESVCGRVQARNAAFRCIELRRPMVRAANKGLNCCIAPNGAILDSLQKADGSHHLAGYSYAVLPVDKNAGLTLYAMLGDWAVLACLLLALLTASPAIIDRIAKKKAAV